MANLISIIALVGVVVILIMAAISDIRHRLIPNSFSILLVGLYGVFVASNYFDSGGYQINILNGLLVGGIMLIGGLILFALNIMGGGDVKLAASLSLFAGTHYISAVLILIALMGGLIAGLTLAYTKLRSDENKVDDANRHSVPYGVAISISGVWLCVQLIQVVYFGVS